VYAASGADVSTSIIGGRVVMRDRRLLTIDLAEAVRAVRKIGEDIRRSNHRSSGEEGHV
jgi:cytosine/adenosine deaminase-related metal-dependent hydrolase